MAGIKRFSISDGIDGAGELGVALDGSGFNLHDALFNFALHPECSVKLSAGRSGWWPRRRVSIPATVGWPAPLRWGAERGVH